MKPVQPGSARAWWLAARPATLGASVAPVLVGMATAFAEERDLLLPPALACLAAALLLQLAANFINDYADYARGADGEGRLGPPRAAQQGWLQPRALQRAAAAALLSAAALGAYLINIGGWPIAAIGAAALFCAWAYTGGPYPLAYRGWGDALVFLFFGPAAVVGTHYVQAGEAPHLPWGCALPMGLLAALLLSINNLRDAPQDARNGKRTVAVRLFARGEIYARRYGIALMAGAFLALLPCILFLAEVCWWRGDSLWRGFFALMPLGSAFIAHDIYGDLRGKSGGALNVTLKHAGTMLWCFGMQLAAGILWAVTL